MSRLIQCYFVMICELYKQFLSESCFYTIFFQCINKPCASYMDSHPSLSKTFTDLLNITETNAQLYCCWERESEWHVICHNRRTSSQQPACFSHREWVASPTHSMREKTQICICTAWPTDAGIWLRTSERKTEVRDERLFQNSTTAITSANHCNNESRAMRWFFSTSVKNTTNKKYIFNKLKLKDIHRNKNAFKILIKLY